MTLAELRGSVVVLDFWATWCGPCKRGLPLLQKVHDWAATEGHPVRVFAVNMAERERTPEAKHAKVSQFWSSTGYTMPVLMDLDDAISRAYGVGPIPHSVVIGPDGVIQKVHIGYDAKMDTTLKTLSTRLLEES